MGKHNTAHANIHPRRVPYKFYWFSKSNNFSRLEEMLDIQRKMKAQLQRISVEVYEEYFQQWKT